MHQKSQQSGRSLVETLAVLAIIAILTIAGLLGYSFVLRKHQEKQTVKQVAEVGIRYGLNRVKPRESDHLVPLKTVYPEAERENSVTMLTPDHGRVRIHVIEQTDAYQIEVNQVSENSCHEILASGAYDAILYDISQGKNPEISLGSDYLKGKSSSTVAIGSEYLKKGNLSREEEERLRKLTGKTKEEIIEAICTDQQFREHFMALIWGGNCSKSTASYLHSDGKCWFCPEDQKEDKYHQCCKENEMNKCGVCHCPDKTICDDKGENPSYTCVECIKDEDCPGGACDEQEHKCVPCIPRDTTKVTHSRGCEDEMLIGKPWCSDNRICEECLESYKEDDFKEYNCKIGNPSCNNKVKEPDWKCEPWPCEKKILKEECLDGESGDIREGGKCSDDCRCAQGLTCGLAEGETCSTCQCAIPDRKDRTRGKACNDDSCPCAGNLTCDEGVCSCLEENAICKADEDCCTGYCEITPGATSGTCKKPVCKLTNGSFCVPGSHDLDECCAAGTLCLTIGENSLCCPTKEGETTNGEAGSYCESNECCKSGECNISEHKCVDLDKCGGNLLDRWQSCAAEGQEECCDSSKNLTCSSDKYCCPIPGSEDDDGTCRKIDGKSVCCNNPEYPNCIAQSGDEGFCCKTTGEDYASCDGESQSDPNDCCLSGICTNGTCCPAADNLPTKGQECHESCGCKEGDCVLDPTDNKYKCKSDACPVDGSCSAANQEQCCLSKKCDIQGDGPYQCCPEDDRLPGPGEACSATCGCAGGEQCGEDGKCPIGCSNTEDDRRIEGAECSEQCPCGTNIENEKQMVCGPDHKCHTCPVDTYWFRPNETVAGACCPREGGLPNGQLCTTDSCCQSGNCAKVEEGDEMGVCCQSAFGLMLRTGTALKEGNGKCCEKVNKMGDTCTPTDGSCCTEGHCRKVYIKMSSRTVKHCSCGGTSKSKCRDACGNKASCYYCTKMDCTRTYTTQTAWKQGGLTGPTRCCPGNGDLGSPCSELCPCKGTAFQYYKDGELTKTAINYEEYDDVDCSCRRTPELYCRPEGNGRGTCQLNPILYVHTGERDRTASKVSCSYHYDFKNKSKKECYLCPADSVFREDKNYVACCPLKATKVETSCVRYSKKQYKSNHTSDKMEEGMYKDEKTGLKTLCPKGSYCKNGERHPCDAGTYSDFQGAAECRFCGVGYFCPEGATKKTACPKGNYCTGWTAATPTPCPAGTYTEKTAQSNSSACVACPKGYFCPGGKDRIKCDNKTLPGACPNKGMAQPIEGSDEDGKARYLSGGKLKLCEKGYYCDGTRRYACKAGTYADTTGSTQCKQAPVGVAIPGLSCTGSSDKNNWKVCAAGTYAEGEGNVGCKKCPSGTYQNQKGQGSCISCPEGQMSKEGATKASECKSCENEARKTATQTECCSSANKVAVKNEATGFEFCCPAGKRYCKGKKTKSFACYADKDCALTQEQAETQDKHCTEKQYVKNNVCTACPAGYSCNGSSAEKCKPGSYAPAGSGVCTLCPVGKYQTASGQESCKTPTGNQYVDEEGATTVKHCEGINVVPNKAKTGCKTCPEGTMPDKNHAVCSGRSCKKGFMYVDGACRRCLENHYCPDGYHEYACGESSFSLPGAVKCITCKAGTYWNPTSGSCQKCPAGFMCSKGLRSKCPAGTTSSEGAGKCYSCNPGQYFKSNSCKACDAGTYSAGGTVTKCKACPEGTRQAQKGQGSCVNCPTGKWSNAGSAECKIKCPAKFFCSDGKKEKCAKCKAGATTKP